MQQLSQEIEVAFKRRLIQAQVPAALHPSYHKWLRFYFLFCEKFQCSPDAPTSLGPFLTKLAAKNQPIEQRRLAAATVRFFLRSESRQSLNSHGDLPSQSSPAQPVVPATPLLHPAPEPPRTYQPTGPPPSLSPLEAGPQLDAGFGPLSAPFSGRRTSWEQEYRDLESAIKLRNYSTKTLEAYRLWVSKFQAFVRSRPTAQLGTREVRGFLSSLAVQRHVSASTQNQAFNSLLFFFRHVLGRAFGKIDGVVRPKRHVTFCLKTTRL